MGLPKFCIVLFNTCDFRRGIKCNAKLGQKNVFMFVRRTGAGRCCFILRNIHKEAVIENQQTLDPKKPIDALTLDQLLSQTGGSIFSLVRLTMARALEIQDGKPPMVKYHDSDKATTIAMEEVRQGKLTFVMRGLEVKKRGKS